MRKRAYLSEAEQRVFYKLFYAAGTYVNYKRKVVPWVEIMDPRYCSGPDADKIVDVMRHHPEDMKEMAQDRTLPMTDAQREIIAGWSRLIFGSFVAVDFTPAGSFFVPEDGQTVYQVYGLRRPMEDFFSHGAPLRITTCLMPFRGKIITDGFFYRGDELSAKEKARFLEIYAGARENGTIQTEM
jgi:hypothetical protein